VLAFVPFAWISETRFVVGLVRPHDRRRVYCSCGALHLPIWWLMFPPLVEGILVAIPTSSV